jgi:hypothetical protein
MLLRLLVVLPLVFLAACTATEPATMPPPAEPAPMPETAPEPEPRPAPTPEPEPMPDEPAPEPEPAPDPLYERTEDDLRQMFTDGLFGLYRAEMDPAEAQRLDRAGVQTWMTDLEMTSPRAVAFARRTLGPVLDQPYLVGFVLEGAAAAECASVRDVLYIPVPERFQGADRPFTGYLVQDACDVTSGELARFCTGGFGETDDGTACSCTCTTGEAPGLGCVSCGGN